MNEYKVIHIARGNAEMLRQLKAALFAVWNQAPRHGEDHVTLHIHQDEADGIIQVYASPTHCEEIERLLDAFGAVPSHPPNRLLTDVWSLRVDREC